MSYFYIPRNYTNISSNLKCVESNRGYVCDSQTLYIHESRINNIINNNKSTWDIYKEEYFHYKNVFNVTHEPVKSCVTKFGAIHRSFYIIWELNNIFNFIDTYKTRRSIDTFHLSKCQTGIIQFLNSRRNGTTDTHMGIYSDEWRKNSDYLINHKNICFNEYISYNFMNHDTLNYLAGNYGRRFNLITFLSNDEVGELRTGIPFLREKDIIITKIIYSIILQKKGGTLIFSVPDIFDETYYEIMYILSSCYEKVIITKPVLIENITNKKMVICSEYIDNYDQSTLINFAHTVVEGTRNRGEGDTLIRLLDCKISSYFLNKLFEIDAIMFQQTIDATLSVINLKNNDDINGHLDKLKRKSIQKSMFWCIHNHFDYDHCVTDSIIGR